ncbi:hypothetical protein NSP_24690 [Nodularia spumigena CCY9414]|nr:hypothetical protein NSP_24690 [Nodularia spumigena CCY9414]
MVAWSYLHTWVWRGGVHPQLKKFCQNHRFQDTVNFGAEYHYKLSFD